jgi:hypothetical protein
MTPHGTDKAFEKRKSTVDGWASKTKEAQTYDNTPMIGFKMGRSVRHGYGWGQGNVKWRIEDPRGFELEISSPNFAQIISFCTLEKGEILEECIWARLGNENILVPVDSDVYRNAARNTERISKSASMKDIKRGDTAILQNGDEGIYYGAFYVTSYEKYGNGLTKQASTTGKKRHVFLMQTPGRDGISSHKFFKATSSAKLSELFSGEKELTHEEAEAEVNRQIKEGVSFDEAGQHYAGVIGVSIELLDMNNFEEEVELTTLDDITSNLSKENEVYLKTNPTYFWRYLVQGSFFSNYNGQMVLVDVGDYMYKKQYAPGGSNHHPHYLKGNWTTRYTHILEDVFKDTGDILAETRSASRGSGYYAQNYTETVGTDIDTSVEDLPNDMHRFKRTIKTASGLEFTYYR